MLKAKGWLKDVRGENRTQYSLRHTYATFKLLYTEIDVVTLAQYMGTSIRMIEAHYADDLKSRKAHIILREKWPKLSMEDFTGKPSAGSHQQSSQGETTMVGSRP